MSVQPVNLMVFREGRRETSACRLKSELVDQLRLKDRHLSPRQALRLLLLAGELECGVADSVATSSNPPSASLPTLMSTTNALAEILLGATSRSSVLAETLDAVQVPDCISVSAPEGFAYYALHPLAYADVLNRLPALSNTVAVIGIRSIGSTLSAVVTAAGRMLGRHASRITVRPQGHAYNRELLLSRAEYEFVSGCMKADADFLIVDEGPGLSGSSFLSVAEALVKAGVGNGKITLLCGHQPDFRSLRADHAAQRALQFRWLAVDHSPRLPQPVGAFLGGGDWRNILIPHEAAWPPSWTWFERLKYQSADEATNSGLHGQRLYKFLGLGHYGDNVFARELRVAKAGFGPEPTAQDQGFASYPWIVSRPMCQAYLNRSDLRPGILETLADYCAFRSTAFPAERNDLAALEQMAGHNLRELCLEEYGPVQLPLVRPVICDGHMQPHEWLLGVNGKVWKTDSGSHGDDHFYPGPTDIAWDLAGAVVEWEMNAEQAATFIDLYRQKTGDDAARRIDQFVVAYSVFRAAYSVMAANALGGSDESARFLFAAEKYKRRVQEPPASFPVIAAVA